MVHTAFYSTRRRRKKEEEERRRRAKNKLLLPATAACTALPLHSPAFLRTPSWPLFLSPPPNNIHRDCLPDSLVGCRAISMGGHGGARAACLPSIAIAFASCRVTTATRGEGGTAPAVAVVLARSASSLPQFPLLYLPAAPAPHAGVANSTTCWLRVLAGKAPPYGRGARRHGSHLSGVKTAGRGLEKSKHRMLSLHRDKHMLRCRSRAA